MGGPPAREPIGPVTAFADVAGVAAAVASNGKVGFLSAALSVANDPHDPVNVTMNVAPYALPEAAGLPLAFLGAETDLLNAEAKIIMTGMLEAIPGDTMDNGNGVTIPSPDAMNVCESLGGNGC